VDLYGTSAIPTSEWVHICGTSSSTNGTRIYINGTLTYSNSDTTTVNTSNMTCGKGGGSGEYMKGWVDEAMIFNKELSSSEIQDIILKRFDDTHAAYGNCYLWWSMDDPRLGDRTGPRIPV
jgi:hypothetical protein